MQKILPVLTSTGADAGTLELGEGWLELRKGTQAVHQSVVAFQAGRRAGTASTKTRASVRGGGAKPYRQKGTGRARAGSIRSPLWRGGGVTFGPQPRSFAKSMSRKVRRLALQRAFSERVEEGAVLVVDELVLAQPRTRLMIEFLDAVNAGDNVLVVVDDLATNLVLAARNLPRADVMKAAAVNPYWLLLFKKIVFTRAGLEAVVARFPGREKSA